MFKNIVAAAMCMYIMIGYAFAQPTTYQYETWWGVMTSARMTNKLSLWNDVHFVNDLFFIYRNGITYHNAKDNLQTTVGYGILRLGTAFSQGDLIRNEHRPWMQTVYRLKPFGRWSTSFRFRYDARFLQQTTATELLDSYIFTQRFRYSNALRCNTGWKPGGNNTFMSLLNEALFNRGPVGFRFEHRAHLLANININTTTVSIGYVARYIELSPDRYRINHGPVFWLTHQFNFVKKPKTEHTEFPAEHNY